MNDQSPLQAVSREARPTPAQAPVQVSFEFFPPKTAEMEATLWKSVERLAPGGPAVEVGFVPSVTSPGVEVSTR